jgi:hypothetical protein
MAPEREQTVCLSCGLCCDGTLFGHAVLKPGEKGNLPSLIEQRVFMIGEKDYFRLTCLYFLGRCTIYSSKRADVCGSFRCRLLSEMSEGRISFEKALEIIKGAVIMRNSLQEEYRSFPESPGILPLTEIMKVLGNYITIVLIMMAGLIPGMNCFWPVAISLSSAYKTFPSGRRF